MTELTERRFTPGRVEVRANADKRTIGGYAAVFNSPSQNLGGFRERLAPGVFNRASSRGWPGNGTGVLARYNHDDNFLLGNSESGTLRLLIDDQGLRYDVDVPTARQDVWELVERGDVRTSSFAFYTEQDEWDTDDTGFPIRTLLQAGVVDVAPVNTPAYLDTSVGLRSLAKKFEAPLEEIEQMAKENELVRLFKRTDKEEPARTMSPAEAMAKAVNL
jgi:HK97 family phage prohead protease